MCRPALLLSLLASRTRFPPLSLVRERLGSPTAARFLKRDTGQPTKHFYEECGWVARGGVRSAAV